MWILVAVFFGASERTRQKIILMSIPGKEMDSNRNKYTIKKNTRHFKEIAYVIAIAA